MSALSRLSHVPRGALLAPAAVLAVVITLTLATTVSAATPFPQIDGPVTDETGLLSGGEDRIEEAVDELLAAHDVQLWVVFVDTTGGTPAAEFASGTAVGNSLGGNDALLVVAIEDRTDQIWVSDGLDEITDDELDAIIGQELEPRLADGDFVEAVVATAEGLGEAAAAGSVLPTVPPIVVPPGDGGFEGPGTETGGGSILPLLLVVGGIGLLGWWLVSRRARHRDVEERDRRTGRLAREANALLIATDERVRDADQEIGFVEAEYGEAEVEPLRAAVVAAREELRHAFAVRQRLDDGEPETPEEREAMLNEIVTRSRQAQAALDAEAQRIQALRDLERDAPTILERLPQRIEAARARLPDSRAAFDALAAYAPATRAPVVGHLEEADKGLVGASAAVDRGLAALDGNDRRVAAREARRAEQGLTGAVALLDAVDKLAATARDAQARIDAELREAEVDLAAARTAAAETGPAAEAATAGKVTAAATALRQAQSAASAVPLDPIAALRAATDAHRLADEALAAVRQDAEQLARYVAAVDTSLATAQADLELAADFIATRRGSVGRQARTRLAEADRLLETAFALRDTDPQRAMEAASRAERLAEEAYDLADDDFDQFGGFGGGGRARDPGTELAGAILGGILGGVLSGGGRGGGWGGSPWGSSGPFGGGGGGWGGPFGGGGGGGWGGGGFGGLGGLGGGGGGRSRGGRW